MKPGLLFLLALLVVMFSFFAAAEPLTLSQRLVPLEEAVTLNIATETLTDPLLIISSDTYTYQHLGIDSVVTFMPPLTGTYTVKLYDQEELVASDYFIVQEKNEPAVALLLSKDHLFLGDSLTLHLIGSLDETSLTITTSSAQYHYLGIEENITYVPPQPGTYTASLRREGIVLSEKTFTVEDPNPVLLGGQATSPTAQDAHPQASTLLASRLDQHAAKVTPRFAAKARKEPEMRVLIKRVPLGGRSTYASRTVTQESLAQLLEDTSILRVQEDQPVNIFLKDAVQIIRAEQTPLPTGPNAFTGQGETICFLDTGVDYTHPYITNYAYGYDFVNNDTDPLDDHGHGTAIGGILSRIAPDSILIAAKVVDATGIGYQSDVLRGLQYCREHNATIISISLGGGGSPGYCDDDLVAQEVNQAVQEGILVVTATGNSGTNHMPIPACAMNATRVAASTKQDQPYLQSNINALVDLFAPGVDITVPAPGGGYQTLTGTSMAAPQVAASAALLREQQHRPPAVLKQLMRRTGQIIPGVYNDKGVTINGSRLDVANALLGNVTHTPYAYTADQFSPGDTYTFRVYAGFEANTTSADGVIMNLGETYADVHDGTIDDSTVWTTNTALRLGQAYAASVYYIRRTYFYFDTSDLPDDAVLQEGNFSIYFYSDGSTEDFYLTIVNGSQAASLTFSDWNNCGTDKGGWLTTNGISTGTYSHIPFNSTGLSFINPTGTTKLCIRDNNEVDATAPTSVEWMDFYTGNHASYKPYITLVYTVPTEPQFDNLTTNVTTTVTTDDTINFTASWTNTTGDQSAKLLVANNSAFTNCNYDTTSGCMCYSAADTAGGEISCAYSPNSEGNLYWYAKVCESSGLCDANFSVTYPKTTSDIQAYEKSGLPSTPTDYDSEATTTDYENINESDDNRWVTELAETDGGYDTQIYLLTITELANTTIQLNITWEGYGENRSSYYTNLSAWNWSSGAWQHIDNNDFTSNADAELSALLTPAEDYINTSTRQIAILATTKKFVEAVSCDGWHDGTYCWYESASFDCTTFCSDKGGVAGGDCDWTDDPTDCSTCKHWYSGASCGSAASLGPYIESGRMGDICYYHSDGSDLCSPGSTPLGAVGRFCACENSPFVYIYKEGVYQFISDFIPGADSPDKEFVHTLDITPHVTNNQTLQLKITEELNETTYLDNLYLQATKKEKKTKPNTFDPKTALIIFLCIIILVLVLHRFKKQRQPKQQLRRDMRGIAIIIFFSGFSALLYELIWVRLFITVFGSSTQAIATVTGLFLLGIGMGSLLFGNLIHRSKNPKKAYALLELGIGLVSLITFLLFFFLPVQDTIHRYLYTHTTTLFLVLARLLLAAVYLLPPALLIGGTLPVLAKNMIKNNAQLGLLFSRLYYLHTLGSVGGIILTAFLLVHYLGVLPTILIAILINLSIGTIVFVSKKDLFVIEKSANTQHAQSEKKIEKPRPNMLGVLFVTGFVSLGLEVLLTRILTNFGVASTQSLAVILMGFLIGISVGSIIISRRVDALQHKTNTLTLFIFVTASAILGSTIILSQLNSMLPFCVNLVERVGLGFQPFLIELVFSLMFAFIPFIMFGLLFPIIYTLYSGNKQAIGRKTGKAYLWNTLGALLGALITGFVLITQLGIKVSAILLTLLLLSSMVFFRNKIRLQKKHVLLAILVGVLILALVLVPGNFYKRGTGASTLYYAEGQTGSIVVIQHMKENNTYTTLSIDSQAVAGNEPYMVIDSKMLAHLPLLVADNPTSAATVGYGSGGTSYSMLLHGVQVHALEIEPKVIEASKHFPDMNNNTQHHENLTIVLDDARNYLKNTNTTFDVIVTDVTNLKYKANPFLYTTDYFAIMKNRLTPDGVAAAWIPLGGLSFSDLQILLSSFASVFDHTTVWFFNQGQSHFLLFIATPNTTHIDLDNLHTKLVPVKEDLARIGVDNELELAAMMLLGEQDVNTLAYQAPHHTDNKPILEFSDPSYHYRRNTAENFGKLLQYAHEDKTAYYTGDQNTINTLRKYFANLETIYQTYNPSRYQDVTILKPKQTSDFNLSAITASDDTYLVFNQGDQFLLDFDLPSTYDKLELVTEGYYLEHYRKRLPGVGTHNSLNTDYVFALLETNASGVFNVTIDNDAPNVTTPVVFPASPTAVTTTLNCSFNASDVENATLRYEFYWYNGTVLYNNTNYSGVANNTNFTMNITATLAKTEVWNCTVRAYDGIAYSGYASTTVTVANAPPSISGVTITPADPLDTENLVCKNQTISDADNDESLISLYSWLVDDTPYYNLYLPFETNTSTVESTVSDYSGNGYDGVLGYVGAGSFVIDWTPDGKRGGAYTISVTYARDIMIFDNADLVNTLNTTSQLTVAAWVNKSTPTDWRRIAAQSYWYDSEPNYRGSWIVMTNDQEEIMFGTCTGGTMNFLNSTSTLTQNEWTHVAVTYDGSNTSIYINGQLDNSTTEYSGSIGVCSENYNITVSGAWNGSMGQSPWGGMLDEVYIANRSLSAEQITNLYQEGGIMDNASLASQETASGENWTCVVTPHDSIDKGTPSNDSVLITTLNTAPNITTPSILPLLPNASTTELNCSFNASDAENATLRYEFYWYNGTVLYNNTNYSGVANNTNFTMNITATLAKTEVWNCTVRAYDGTNYSDNASANVTVANSPSTIPDTLGLNEVNVSDTLTASCSGSTDADSGDALTYYYEFTNENDSVIRQAWSTTNTYVITTDDAHDVINVTCGVSDGTVFASQNITNQTTVDNQWPTIDTPVITPADPYVKENLNCSVTAYDNDLDDINITLAWYQDGGLFSTETFLVSNNTNVSSVVNNASTLPGEEWECRVNASDNVSNSSTTTDTVTINGCNPTGDWVVDYAANCSQVNISVVNLNVTTAGNITLTDTNLTVQGWTEINGNLTMEHGGGTLWQNGNLTVKGIFVLDNDTLRMNVSSDGEFGILVNPALANGYMEVKNGANITNGESATSEYFFRVAADANFTMYHSILERSGWAETYEDAGLIINSTKASFYNNTILNSYTGATVLKDNLTLHNNTIRGAVKYGIWVSGANNVTVRDTSISDSASATIGILIHNSAFCDVLNNSITSPNYGISFNNGDDGLAENNILDEGSIHGIYLYNSERVNLSRTTIRNYDDANRAGIYVLASTNGTFTNLTLDSNTYGIVFKSGSKDNLLKDSVITGSTRNDTFVDVSSSAFDNNNTLLNTTLDKTKMEFTGCDGSDVCELWVQWYLDVQVNNSLDGALSSATVQGNTTNNVEQFSDTTDVSGFITTQNVTEFVAEESGITWYTNYTIWASKAYYTTNSTSFNLTASNTTSVFLERDVPRITQLNITPISAYTNDSLNCSATAVHDTLTNLNLTISWYNYSGGTYVLFNTTNISTTSGTEESFLLDSSFTQKGDTWNCTVTANDSVWTSTTNSTLRAIVNAPPLITGVDITPATPTTDQNLTCSDGTITDHDQDTTTAIYHWLVDNQSLTVLNMPFDTNVSSTDAGAVKDYALGNNGTRGAGTASTSPSWTSGIVGGGYDYDGNDFISTASELTPPTGNITMCAWVYPHNAGDRRDILTWSNSQDLTHNTHDRQLYMNSARTIGFYIWDGDLRTATSSGTIGLNSWSFVCGAINGTTNLLVFINGSINGTTTIASTPYNSYGSPYLGIGKGKDTSNNQKYFDGVIDQVMIFNRTLSESQLTKIYEETKDGLSGEFTIVADETVTDQNWTCVVTPNDAVSDGTAMNDSVIISEESIDLYTNEGNISFNVSNPAEGENITINATIYNNGSSAANSLVIQFYLGDPDSGGTQIGDDVTIDLSANGNATANMTWLSVQGVSEIYVLIDPPYGSGSFSESDETNNKASKNITVSIWQTYYGKLNATLYLANSDNKSLRTWFEEQLAGNIFVADYDTTSGISFTSLQALARNTTNGSTTNTENDFEEIDTNLGTTNYPGNVNDTFTAGGSPIQTQTWEVFSKQISNVPYDNSTNTSAFVTGILWDTDDSADAYYDSTEDEDLVFITKINKSQEGQYGTYDYEIKVPGNLKQYKGSEDAVTFYYELQ